jgi:predicted 3-demethylubiquinone-9 3-methyltransferase (glyoxalase superfamily)
MTSSALTALMFVGVQCGRANEALDFYAQHIPGLIVQKIVRITEETDPRCGDVQRAEFTIGETPFIVFDSAGPHQFTFTPAMSIWLNVDDEHVFSDVFDALAEGGTVLMPASDYGFSRLFAWVDDRFTVSWQLNVPFAHSD